MSSIKKLAIRFARDEGGNFAVIGGLMLVPILATMGAAVDYSQAYGTKSKLQATADTATLAAARDAGSINEFYDLTRAYMAANNPELDLEITPKAGPESVEVNVKYRYQTAFLAMAGISEIPVEVETEVAIHKFNRTTIDPTGGKSGKRGKGTIAPSPGEVVAALEDLRDRLLQRVGTLPPRKQEEARQRIRKKFAYMIRKARKGEYGGSPVYIKR